MVGGCLPPEEVKAVFEVERRGRYEVQAKVAGQQAGPEPVQFVLRAGSNQSEQLSALTFE